jgi:hypothetical protein
MPEKDRSKSEIPADRNIRSVKGLEEPTFSPLLLTEKLAGRTVEKVQFRAGRTNDGFMRALGLVVIRCGQPMLHVHSGLRAFEEDGTGHPP